MKKKEFLKYLKFNLYFLVLLLALCSCSQKNDKEYVQLRKEIKKIYGVHLSDNTKCIFIINDNYCPTCVNRFSQFVLDKLNNHDDVLCFINSNGINVDLDSFKGEQNKNVHISTNVLQSNSTLIPPSLGVIFLKDAKIDTIVYINSDSILEQLDFLNSKANF